MTKRASAASACGPAWPAGTFSRMTARKARRPARSCGNADGVIVVTRSLPADKARLKLSGPAAGIDQQDRGWRVDAHGAVAMVVLRDAIALRCELQAIARDAGPIDEVAKRQLCRAWLKGTRRARDLDAIAQQDGLGVDGAVGAHPRGELKRLALVDHARQVERFDGDVRRLAAAEQAEVDRQPARRRLVRRRHHRRSVRLAVREHDQTAPPLARDQAGGETDRAAQIAAVAVHLLHERARLDRTPRATVRCAPRVRT